MLPIIANAVASASNPTWYSTVLARKMTIVNGIGTVYGAVVNLEAKFGLNDGLWR